MTRVLPGLAVVALLGVLAVPNVSAADPPKVETVKPLPMQVFDKLLDRNKDMTYEQLHAKAYRGRVYANKLPFDPTTATHFDTVNQKLQLTPEELAIFKKTGFVSIDQNRRHSFASAYFQIHSQDLPVLVTND